MKNLHESPGKDVNSILKLEDKTTEIEERITEKSLQTVSLFDSAKEEIEQNKTNIENLATMYSGVIEQFK